MTNLKHCLSLLLIVLTSFLRANEVWEYPFSCVMVEEEQELLHQELPDTRANPQILEQISKRSKGLEARLKRKIFGQNEAVRETAHAILRYAAGVNDPNTPIATLLYCGPSGVGKTELAKQLAIELYDNQNQLFRINMSEFSESATISRLIGAPPGYIGYETGGSLANRLREIPHSIVLLDEVEKGHPKVLKLFMHVFDAGYFTSSQGHHIDCRHAIFILTSNVAASEIAELFQMGLTSREILDILQPHLMEFLTPEMYNRLDCMIFSPLSEEIFDKLVRKILADLRERVLNAKGIDLCFDQSLVNHLKSYSLDPKLGARPLKRIVEKELTTILAKAIIDHQCKKGDLLLCSYLNKYLYVEVIFSIDESAP